jgi:hypothetical protein
MPNYNQFVAPPVGDVSDGSTTTGSIIANASGVGYAVAIIPLTTISAGSVAGGIDQAAFDTAVAAFASSASLGSISPIRLGD